MSVREHDAFFIEGRWQPAQSPSWLSVIDPSTEDLSGRIALGGSSDVEIAVAAARRAFPSWSATPVDQRLALLRRIIEAYRARESDLVAAVMLEIGAPRWLATKLQVVQGLGHFQTAAAVLGTFAFEARSGRTRITKEPIGVCGLITPWNWPLNQIAAKVAPALATGCTIVLKPSELAPYSALVFAEVLHAAGVPAGVFNLVLGDGPTVGAAIAAHPDIDMVSFTGSTRAGIEVARAAALSVKRVHQELGGKSPNLILPDADFALAIRSGVRSVMLNSGQTCSAPTRMLVPHDRLSEALELATAAVGATTVGAPDRDAVIGPVANPPQWAKVQRLIEQGIAEGAPLLAGGPGRPDGVSRGFFVRPTLFGPVGNNFTIAREEIFGPVLTVTPYADVEDAITLANDTVYGLSAHVWGEDTELVERVASRLRAGQVVINGAMPDLMAPFGGYKQSGNGREWGAHAFDEFLEVKAVISPAAKGPAA